MKTINRLLLFSLILCLNACGDTTTSKDETPPNGTAAEAASQIFQKLNVGDFQAKMDELEEVQIIDVRTIEELQETGYIPKAQHIDYKADNFAAIIGALDKDKPVMVYCKSGGRSGNACDMLKKMNFKEIYDLEGGVTAWKSASMPTESIEAEK